MEVVSYNQGTAGAGMMGAASLDASLVHGFASLPTVDLRLVGPRPSTILQRLSARPWPPLDRFDLDWHPVRWHHVEAAKAKRTLDSVIADHRPDLMMINSHVCAFAFDKEYDQFPTAVHVDVLVEPWAQMAIWRRWRGYSAVTLRASVDAERRVLDRATVVLAWSSWAAEQVRRSAPSARIVQWHPGLNLDYFRPASIRSLRPRPRVLFVGGRFAQKGGHDLVRVLRPMLGTDVDLDIVCSSAPPGLPEQVVLHELRQGDPGLLDLFQQADLLVLPTYGDSVPWVLLEAMACGTPVVTTDVGGIAEMVDYGRAGRLVRPGDLAGLGSVIVTLLGDDSARADLAVRGLQQVRRRYDARMSAAALLDLKLVPIAARPTQ